MVGVITYEYGGQALISAGISMAVGGVIQMLSGHPSTKTAQDDGSNPSYSFNGAVNTTAQGHPVPVGYGGNLEVGSAVISAAITVGVAVSGTTSGSTTASGSDGATDPDTGPSGTDNTVYQSGGNVIFGNEGGN